VLLTSSGYPLPTDKCKLLAKNLIQHRSDLTEEESKTFKEYFTVQAHTAD